MIEYIKSHFSSNKIYDDKYINAGIYTSKDKSSYTLIRIIVHLLGGILLYQHYEKYEFFDEILPRIGMLNVAIFIYFEKKLISKKNKIIDKFDNLIPYLLDLMSVCVKTGMTLESTLGFLAKEIYLLDKDTAYLLERTYLRSQIVGVEEALAELYESVPTSSVQSLTYTVEQSIKYGSSISELLSSKADEIRRIQVLTIEEKVGKLSAKMSLPLIIFIMFPIVILIAAPGIMRMMQ